jgi:hypothetical protein
LIIVAFAGLARGGKTTAANYLFDWCKEHGLNPVRMSFAKPMKDAAERLGLSKDKDPKKYRAVLQRWGETRRDPKFRPGVSGDGYWVNRAVLNLLKLAKAEAAMYKHFDKHGFHSEFKETVAIFDDVRYMNELEMIEGMGGTTVFIDGMARIQDMDAEWRKHESERLAMLYSYGHYPDIFDYYVNNNYSEDTLKQLVDHLAPAWLDMEIMT